MPFTPFHMGAGMLAKPLLNKRFSLIAFGLAQIAIDIEPGIGMNQGAEVLHGPSHTIIGALAIAYLVAKVTPSISDFMIDRWNREVQHYKLHWLSEPVGINPISIQVGAYFGTLSHIVLDSLMHHDIHPLAPFTNRNFLIDLVSHDGVYRLCSVMAFLGLVLWLLQKWRARPRDA